MLTELMDCRQTSEMRYVTNLVFGYSLFLWTGFFGCIYCLLVVSLYKSSLEFTAEGDRLVGANENDDDETNPNDYRAPHVVFNLIVFFCVHASLR
jgi:hypothetical protein